MEFPHLLPVLVSFIFQIQVQTHRYISDSHIQRSVSVVINYLLSHVKSCKSSYKNHLVLSCHDCVVMGHNTQIAFCNISFHSQLKVHSSKCNESVSASILREKNA